jgi:translation initiation factor RLI1
MENLVFFGEMYDLPRKEILDRAGTLLRKLRLWEKRDMKLGTFSTGMKKRTHLARVLLHRPSLLFLDEPTSGLDPESAEEVISLIGTLSREEGVTVFLCTHNLHQAEGICDSFGSSTWESWSKPERGRNWSDPSWGRSGCGSVRETNSSSTRSTASTISTGVSQLSWNAASASSR